MEKGFKNVSALKGGFQGWKEAGYPLEVGSIDDPVQIHFSDALLVANETISIHITLKANKKPVSIISLEIGFEPNMLTNPKAVINSTIEPKTPTDRMLSTSLPGAGILKLDFLPASQTQASLNAVIPDGVIATVIFNITPEAKSGTKVNLTNTSETMDNKERFFRTEGQNTTMTLEPITAVKLLLKQAVTWGDIKQNKR